MKSTYYSNGKLLITGEYLVLNGAHALALPTKFGQSLHITPSSEINKIKWNSLDADGTSWFNTNLHFEDIINNTDFEEEDPIKNTLTEILHQAYKQNQNFLNQDLGYNIETKLTFPRNWGLGTSSTLINNLAQWLNIDAFQLLRESFGGSGYDIACAQNNTPIIYHLENEVPKVKIIDFDPSYKKHIYFVYLNVKQNSRHAIQNYMNKQQFLTNETERITRLTNQLIIESEINNVFNLIEKHEVILSNILELETVKERLFSDFDGVIKSLGAWGGDFIMVLSKENPSDYFKSKGFNTILAYNEMILLS